MQWVYEQSVIDWTALSELYRIAPLGDKKPSELQLAFSNSRYKCFVLEDGSLIGAGRAVADGIDCSYLCDIAVHPEFQGRGLGRAITMKLTELSAGHKKIILYANPGTESFYERLGFRRMKTAMATTRNARSGEDWSRAPEAASRQLVSLRKRTGPTLSILRVGLDAAVAETSSQQMAHPRTRS
jgi:ribosomal protein S18 acetylase RimI-like enzyme